MNNHEIRVRHKSGHLAGDDQINALVDIARGSRMDESWFGEISEARAKDGSLVHVVRDLEKKSWLTLKYAVKLVNEGIYSPRDYVDEAGAEAFESLLSDLGIIADYGDLYWSARFVGRSKKDVMSMMNAVMENDLRHDRFRYMAVIRRSGSSPCYLDLGDSGYWGSSMCLWLAERLGLAFDVYFLRPGSNGKFNHVVFDGDEVTSSSVVDEIHPALSAEDIVKKKRR